MTDSSTFTIKVYYDQKFITTSYRFSLKGIPSFFVWISPKNLSINFDEKTLLPFFAFQQEGRISFHAKEQKTCFRPVSGQ
jgi:hypothetical protein